MITKKNLLSLLLTIVMLLSLITVVPVTASADEEPYIASDFLMAKIYSGTQRLTAKQYSDQIGCTFSEKDSYIVRTGTKAKMYNKEYTVVVMGDCSPDGKVDATDIITIKRHLLKISTLEGIYAESVSFDGTGKISSTDYIRVKRYMLGIVDRLEIPRAYDIPDFTGKTKAEATELAESAGLEPVFETVNTTEHEEGKVFEQSVYKGLFIMGENKITLKIAGDPSKYTPLNYDIMKAMWLSQFDMNYALCLGSTQRPEEEYREMVKKICDNFADNGFNTVIIQLRPNGDSFYPSEIYTPSYYVTGSYYNDEFVYDPLTIFLEEAHSRKLSVQGWLNPYRCMTKSQISAVSEDYLIGKWYQNKELRAKYLFYDSELTGNNYYYLNPAYDEVQKMVIDGAIELCTKYDIDGIHFDDYFYPTSDEAFDAAAYKALGGGRSLKQFRKDNVNKMVKTLYSEIKKVNPGIIFGISPAGNLDNCRNYLFCDVDTWGSTPGYVDYLMPQLYWGFNYSWWYAKYGNMMDMWSKVVTSSKVKFIPGLPIFKTLASQRYSSDGTEWTYSKNVLARMTTTAKQYGCGGVCGFSYQHFFSRYDGSPISESSKEAENFFAAIKAWK